MLRTTAPTATSLAPVEARLRRWAATRDPRLAGRATRGRDAAALGLLTLAVSVAYLALLHPYWVRGNDNEFYVGLARNIAQGQGFRFNGNPVSMVPPGWPGVLAGAMLVTPHFLYLKLISVASLVAFAALSYRLARRSVGVGPAFWGCLIAATGSSALQLSYTLLSDPMFCAFGAAAGLLAARLAEGARPVALHAAGVALCAVAALSMRWTGLMLLPLIGAILMNGRAGRDAFVPRLDRRWTTLAATTAAVFAAFYAFRAWLVVSPGAIDPRYPDTTAVSYPLWGETEANALERAWIMAWNVIEHAGQYPSGLIWEFAARSAVFREEFNLLGWGILILCGVAAWRRGRRGEWVLAGALLFLLPIAMRWPYAVARYSLPTAPLVFAGAIAGFGPAAHWLAGRARRLNGALAFDPAPLARRAAVVFVASSLSVAAVTWAGEFAVAHSDTGTIQDRYEAGIHRRLAAIARYLPARMEAGDEVAVAGSWLLRDTRPGRSENWFRTLNCLTDVPVQMAPREFHRDPRDDPAVRRWLAGRGVRWYAWQPRWYAYWHLRGEELMGWAFDGVSPFRARPDDRRRQDWILFEIAPDGSAATPVDVPPLDRDWPRRVPRLDPEYVEYPLKRDPAPAGPAPPPAGWEWAG